MSPTVPEHISRRATADQVMALHRRILWLIVISALSVATNVWLIYNQQARIIPEQARSLGQRNANSGRIDRLEDRFGAMLRWMALLQDKVGVAPPRQLLDGIPNPRTP